MEKWLVAFDLDDTLMREIDFVKSAWRSIAKSMAARYGEDATILYEIMESAENAYDALHDYLTAKGYTDVPTDRELVEMYRHHVPSSLEFRGVAEDAIAALTEMGAVIALVTDGRSNTQRAKINALRLDRFVAPEDILISGETGHDKASTENFLRLMYNHPEATLMAYVGDNPAKDFDVPRRLGWTTIALRDTEGVNIHPQQLDGVEIDYIIDDLRELKNILYQE